MRKLPRTPVLEALPEQAPNAGVKRRGRPRGFDRRAALEQAMRMFWQRGFESTATSELASAMGINPPSLYAAFGDKRALFMESLQAYMVGPGAYALQALQRPTAQEAVTALLRGAVQAFTRRGLPTGCMVVLAGIGCASTSVDVMTHLAGQRENYAEMVRARLARGAAEGDLSTSVDVALLAAEVMVIYQGLALAARDGRSRRQLLNVAEQWLNRFARTAVPSAPRK